jgi:hypothetical protein
VKVWIYRGDIAPEITRRPELGAGQAPAGQGV